MALRQTAPTQLKTTRWAVLLAVPVLLAAFWIASFHLTRESLWYDEGWTMWAVHDTADSPESATEAARYVFTSLTDTFSRIRDDVHPPLYYLALDAWVMAVGESVYAVRLLSTLFGMMALAATFAVGARLFDRQTGLMAVVVLGTASFFVYYTREARMYTLLVMLAALSTWAYARWTEKPTRWRTVIYAVLMALMLYTQYVGALVMFTQMLHLLLIRPRGVKWRNMPVPYVLTAILYAPWIPVLLNQMRIHDARPLAESLPTDWGAVAALFLILTSGYWGQYALPFVLGHGIPLLWRDQTGRTRRAIAMVLLWLLVTPVALLALNAWVTPLFQIRYTIAILPAGALLMGYGLRQVGWSGIWVQRTWHAMSLQNVRSRTQSRAQRAVPLQVVMMLFLLLWLAYTQLAMYTEFWPDKSRWNEAAQQMTAVRQPLEPAIIDFNPQSVVAYYDRQVGIREGISVDVAWRDHTPEEMQTIISKLDDAPSVWAVMRSDVPTTWDAVAALDDGRSIGYRDSVMNMIFFRFDAAENDDNLQFRFGDALAYDDGIGHQFYAQTGETFCTPVKISLTAIEPLDGTYQAGFYLMQGYNTVRAQWETILDPADAGETITLSPCMDIADDSPRGPYHLRLVIDHDGSRLPVTEGPDDIDLYWGPELMLAVVHVDEQTGSQ